MIKIVIIKIIMKKRYISRLADAAESAAAASAHNAAAAAAAADGYELLQNSKGNTMNQQTELQDQDQRTSCEANSDKHHYNHIN